MYVENDTYLKPCPSRLPALTLAVCGILLAFALLLAEKARAETHDIASARNTIDGIWDIEDEGSVKLDALTLAINRQWGGIGRRSKDSPLVAPAIVRYSGRSYFEESAANLARSDNGSITMNFGQFGFCMCGSIDYTMRATANPDVMIGEWYYEGDERGTSIWRRRLPVMIESVSYNLRHSDQEQRFIRDAASYHERPLDIDDWHKAYEHSFYLNVYGRGFAGGHDVWLEQASQMEINEASWRCHDGKVYDYGSEWTRCDKQDSAEFGVAGIRLRIIVRGDITSGIKTLWIDGQPVHFYVHAINQPKETDFPALVMLDAVNVGGEQITQVKEDAPFMVKAIYDGDHPEEWISINLPMLNGGTEDGPSQQLVLRRTDNPRIFHSDWLAIKDGPAENGAGE